MDTYFDLTDQQRANLTREQMDQYIRIELMQSGVVIPPPPVLEPVDLMPLLGKERKYCVVNGYTVVAAFSTVEDAQRFVDLRPCENTYDWNIGSDYTYFKPMGDLKIEARDLYRYEDLTAVRAALTKISAAKKANKERQDEYQKMLDAVNKASEAIETDYERLQSLKYTHQRVLSVFDEYCKLAGDPQIAAKFLLKAHPEAVCVQAFEWNDRAWPLAAVAVTV